MGVIKAKFQSSAYSIYRINLHNSEDCSHHLSQDLTFGNCIAKNILKSVPVTVTERKSIQICTNLIFRALRPDNFCHRTCHLEQMLRMRSSHIKKKKETVSTENSSW